MTLLHPLESVAHTLLVAKALQAIRETDKALQPHTWEQVFQMQAQIGVLNDETRALNSLMFANDLMRYVGKKLTVKSGSKQIDVLALGVEQTYKFGPRLRVQRVNSASAPFVLTPVWQIVTNGCPTKNRLNRPDHV